jgi:hypothetical protein
MPSHPVPLAFIACERVEVAETGTRTIHNVFNSLMAEENHSVQADFCLYTSLTNANGPLSVHAEIVHDETKEVLLRLNPVETVVANPLEIVEATLDVVDFVFPQAGYYSIKLYCNGHFLVERHMQIVDAE